MGLFTKTYQVKDFLEFINEGKWTIQTVVSKNNYDIEYTVIMYDKDYNQKWVDVDGPLFQALHDKKIPFIHKWETRKPGSGWSTIVTTHTKRYMFDEENNSN